MNTPVSFEIAKLLRKKGFDEQTILIYQDGEIMKLISSMSNSEFMTSRSFSAPTISEVVMWLYEKHGIFITVTIPYEEFGKFSAEIWIKHPNKGTKILLIDGMTVFDSISRAYEEAIIESLNIK